HWLFTIYVLAILHGINGNALMPMIGRRIYDCVNIVAGEYLPVIACRKKILTPELPGADKSSVIEVAGRDNLHAFHLQCGLHVANAHTSRANHRNTDAVIRGNRLFFYQVEVLYVVHGGGHAGS